jgi:hypothetical protein
LAQGVSNLTNGTALPNTSASFIEAAVLIWCGCLLSVLFVFDVYLPRDAAILLILGTAAWGVVAARANRFALLQRLAIMVYALPFIATLGYLFDSQYLWASTPARLVLIQDDLIILQMLMIGLVGLIGLLAGMKLAESFPAGFASSSATRVPLMSTGARPLSPVVFAGLSALVIMLVWAGSGSTSTIFESAYSGSSGIAESVNFNAAPLLANVILILLYVDAERAASQQSRRRLLLVVGLAGIGVAYELLHGNRDSFGLLIALLALFITGSAASRLNLDFLHSWRRARRAVVPAIGVALVFIFIGALRVLLVSPELLADTQNVLRIAFLENTWTAVLHSNLGLAGLYSDGSMEYLLGQTYVDYVLSIPPGFITQLFDITRPIEADRGPAWWFMGITGGGVHSVVVPFRNFGIFGALAILAVLGAVVTKLDAPTRSLGRRFLFGVVVAASFKWLWYGDMVLIRALMAALVVWLLYRVLSAPRLQA